MKSLRIVEQIRQTDEKTLKQSKAQEMCESPAERSPMPEHQPSQIFKLRNGEITERSSLVTFLAIDTYTYMCLLNHIHIVGSVSDS